MRQPVTHADGRAARGGSPTVNAFATSNSPYSFTGASGLAGSAVLREFVQSSHPVRAPVRNRAHARAFEASPTVEAVEGDMLRSETLAREHSGVDRFMLISS